VANGQPFENVDDCEQMKDFNAFFGSREYNAHTLNSHVQGNSLYFTLMYLSFKLNWAESIPQLNQEKFKNLAYNIQCSYRDVRYHNQVHGADVVNEISEILTSCGMAEICSLSPVDIFITLLSGAAHDMDHPGTNNAFESKSGSKLSILYNDISVLEQHHTASFFFLLENEKRNCNVLMDLNPELKQEYRNIILEQILYTDMSKHGELCKIIKELGQLDPADRDMGGANKRIMLKALVHATDIGNPTRVFDVAKMWGLKIVSEFFNIGDSERALGLPI